MACRICRTLVYLNQTPAGELVYECPDCHHCVHVSTARDSLLDIERMEQIAAARAHVRETLARIDIECGF